MHKYATRLLPASSVWKPNHTSPPNAWWVLNHLMTKQSCVITSDPLSSQENKAEYQWRNVSCQKLLLTENLEKHDYGGIFPILSKWGGGGRGHFIFHPVFLQIHPWVLWNWLDLMLFLLQEEECEENYVKKCFIQYGKTAQNVTVNICRTPLVKDCDIDGEEVTDWVVITVTTLTCCRFVAPSTRASASPSKRFTRFVL